MRNIIFLFAILTLAACNNTNKPAQDYYTIKGTLKGGSNKKVYLYNGLGEAETIDSTVIVNDTFSFTGKVSSPTLKVLKVETINRPLEFIAENADIQIMGVWDTVHKATVTGGKEQDLLNTYLEKRKPLDERNTQLTAIYRQANVDKVANKAIIDSVINEFNIVFSEDSVMMEQFIDEHKTSHASSYLIASNFLYSMELNNLERVYSKLDKTVQGGSIAQKINAHIKSLQKVAIGNPATDFTMNDENGKPVSLSSYKGKVTLVDFWASWCGPCRRENPNIVKAYNAYHAKGFEILGVSLDKDKDKWLQAIKDDQLTWQHVSDLKGWDCAILKDYAVNFIPQNFLLDKEGKIIAKNLTGEQLEAKLKEVQF